jgi:hypothetical protein
MHGASAYQAGENADERDGNDVGDERENEFGVVDDL